MQPLHPAAAGQLTAPTDAKITAFNVYIYMSTPIREIRPNVYSDRVRVAERLIISLFMQLQILTASSLCAKQGST